MVHDTPSHGSDHLCLIWKESIHNCRWYRADTACGTDGRTDGRTDRRTDGKTDGRSETSIPPQQLRCAGGITRTPAFWDTPATPWLPILVIHIRSQVKRRQSWSYKFKKIAKNSNLKIVQETLHATHLPKLLDKMYKYEMDPNQNCRRYRADMWCGMDTGRTDRRTDGVKPIYPPTTSLYNKVEFSNQVKADIFNWLIPPSFNFSCCDERKISYIFKLACHVTISNCPHLEWNIVYFQTNIWC